MWKTNLEDIRELLPSFELLLLISQHLEYNMDLSSLKYADLQKLAKDVGLKANMKADKLLKALNRYYQEQEYHVECGNTLSADNSQLDEPSDVPPSTDSGAFVTKHRGRGKKSKNKQANEKDDGAESALILAGNLDQMDEKMDEPSFKKRRLSEVQPEIPTTATVSVGERDMQSETASAKNGLEAGKGEGKNVRPGKIPRHEGLLKKQCRPALKPTTPNFKKLHEAHFNKMESIDSYVQRKAKQIEVYKTSVKELKMISEKTIPKSADKGIMKPAATRVSLFSPVPKGKRPKSETRRLTQPSARKPAPKDNGVFVPTVMSARKISVRFSQTTLDNEHKRSLVKTPARMSPFGDSNLTPRPVSRIKPETKPALNTSIIKTPGTAFVFTGNTSTSTTPGTNKKNTFDLKASLSRPLSYEPHKGKLKPFGMTQENTALNRSQSTQSHQKKYKQHQVQTREDRRTKQMEDRKQKKEKVLGARRGLVLT
uniref:Nucleolar and spindle associated protein 1 n=1 Tax=Paramormyrops kingsleyae TaxID=1676925 RepID=A0A3B3RCE8_9TELE|nr:nucleolar and spindle-associated protein 1 isoform X1 [Paramormyrops kingsleyae]